jgi:hypothetical protein
MERVNFQSGGMMKFLNLTELQEAYATGGISAVTLFASGDVFEVRIVTADGVAQLAQEEEVLVMRNPSELLLVLKRVGIVNVHIDTTAWRPGVGLLTHQEWVNNKVQNSLAGLRDGSNRTFSTEEWMAIRAAKKASRGAS